MEHQDPTKPILLSNTTCIYCGRPFDTGTPAMKEHVIGRWFGRVIVYRRRRVLMDFRG